MPRDLEVAQAASLLGMFRQPPVQRDSWLGNGNRDADEVCQGEVRSDLVSEAHRLFRNRDSQQIRHVERAGIAGFGRQLRFPIGLKLKV
jgi:hypothetical protein